MQELRDLTLPELLAMHAAISEELRRRGVTRSSNNPVGDLAEHLFRDLPDHGFDVLAAVLLQEDYRVLKAALIPHARVLELAKRVERTNSWRFLLRDNVWSFPDVRDVTDDLRKAELAWAEALVKEPAST